MSLLEQLLLSLLVRLTVELAWSSQAVKSMLVCLPSESWLVAKGPSNSFARQAELLDW